MIDSERSSIEEIVREYKPEVEELVKFLPWLERRSGNEVMRMYDPGVSGAITMGIPVYDGTLLQFVKYLGQTSFMNRNYMYVYRKYGIRTPKDELRIIARADIGSMDILGAILSRYTIQGRVKGAVWKEGMDNGVYLQTVKKLKELIEFWDMPIDNQ
ncbi:MAG: hypothetical protein MJ119_04030 [Lachnospiraceae bacterium]|nr:hypothetical protein [Lachnospiraceae bacterium]